MGSEQPERELLLLLMLTLTLTFALGMAGPPLAIGIYSAMRLYYGREERR